MDIELAVLAGRDSPTWQVDAALDLGLDLVGGAPHLADDPSADLQRLLAVAERRGCGVDLHTDESLDGPTTLAEFARTVRGWRQNVSAGHCVRLATLPADERAEAIREVVASRIGVIANPITNLYLQGWEHRTRRSRAGSPPCASSSTPAPASPPAPTTCATRSIRSVAAMRSRPRPCS